MMNEENMRSDLNDRPAPIEVRGVSKSYPGSDAVAGLDLTVPEGSIFGLVGRNGAGKTTTMNLLLGMLAPNEGEVRIFGEDSLSLSKNCRQRIGYLSEEPFPYDMIFVDILRFLSRFFDDWDWGWCERLMERLRVDGSKRLSAMSFGQRRVAELLLAVAHRPELLILDDPAVGLDATARKDMLWTLLESSRDEGCTIVFASHILQDVERVVDQIGILDGGVLRMSGSLDEIKGRTRRLIMPVDAAPSRVDGELTREVRGRDVVIVTDRFDASMSAELPGDSEAMNLEDIFVAVARESDENASSAAATQSVGGV